MKYLPLEECKNGGLYRISSRNLALGVYREEVKGFIGIREKFDNEFLFTTRQALPLGPFSPRNTLRIARFSPSMRGSLMESFSVKTSRSFSG